VVRGEGKGRAFGRADWPSARLFCGTAEADALPGFGGGWEDSRFLLDGYRGSQCSAGDEEYGRMDDNKRADNGKGKGKRKRNGNGNGKRKRKRKRRFPAGMTKEVRL